MTEQSYSSSAIIMFLRGHTWILCGCSPAEHFRGFFLLFWLLLFSEINKKRKKHKRGTTHSHPVACCLICPSLYQFLVIANSNKGSGPTVTETVGTETAHYTTVQTPSHSFVVISALPSSSPLPGPLLLPLSLSCMFFQSSMKSQPILLLASEQEYYTLKKHFYLLFYLSSNQQGADSFNDRCIFNNMKQRYTGCCNHQSLFSLFLSVTLMI